MVSSPAVYRGPEAGAAADPFAALNQTAAQHQAIERCIEPVERAQFLWIICGVVLILAVAVMIYWAIPLLKIRRDNLVPLTEERAPGVDAYLAELCHKASLAHPPTFLVNPHNHSASGVAFGRRGRRYVVLNVGLLVKFYADRPAFRAVVLHELAHLRNADVDKTYFSVAVGITFAIVALWPLAVSLIHYLISAGDPRGPSFVFGMTWHVLALAALVYLTLAAILRIREVYGSDQARISFFLGPVVLAVLVQVSIAIIVAARVRWLGVLHSLFAAFVAGCVMAVGILGLNLAFGGTIDPSFAWTTFALVLNGGALLSLPLSGGVFAMGSWVRRPRPK